MTEPGDAQRIVDSIPFAAALGITVSAAGLTAS